MSANQLKQRDGLKHGVVIKHLAPRAKPGVTDKTETAATCWACMLQASTWTESEHPGECGKALQHQDFMLPRTGRMVYAILLIPAQQ